jgi:release factor glutamine methyltransferase
LRHIIETAPDYLRAGGVLVLEIGYDQAESVIDIATHRNAYKGIYVGKDFSGLARVVRMTAKKL